MRDYLNYEDFICVAQAQMQEKLGDEMQVQLHQITKNNSVVLDALSISEKGGKIAPTIYLNDFYQEYLDGKTMPELIEQMEEIYQRCRPQIQFDTAFYADFPKVRDHLACRLINRDRNRELLKRIPHRPFLDLEMIVYYSFEDSNLGIGTILVYESHRKAWRVTEEELFETARENTLRLHPEEFLSMEGILEKYRSCGIIQKEDEDAGMARPMYVLTNRDNYFGASGLLFDSVLQKIARELDDDFWILPSSVHECIVVPAGLSLVQDDLKLMVREINRTEVAPEDYLSDEVYYYQSKIHKLSM